MDMKWVLRVAIEREREAAEGYAALAEEAEGPEARKLLSKMSREEGEHQAMLERVDPDAVGDFLPEPNSFATVRKLLRKLPAGQRPEIRHALRLAMEKEEKAQELYAELAGTLKDEEASAMFRMLSAMEGQHADWLGALCKAYTSD